VCFYTLRKSKREEPVVGITAICTLEEEILKENPLVSKPFR
jgi:hypothetical protein